MEAIMSAPGDRLTNTQIDKPTVRRGTRNSSVHDILCAVDVDALQSLRWTRAAWRAR